jgi:hypothetical protein
MGVRQSATSLRVCRYSTDFRSFGPARETGAAEQTIETKGAPSWVLSHS